MAKKASVEKIVQALRQAEVLQGQGRSVSEACRELAISEQTHYRWKKEYGALKLDQAKRLRELENENARLKKVVADLSLDCAILKEACRGNCPAPRSESNFHESPSAGGRRDSPTISLPVGAAGVCTASSAGGLYFNALCGRTVL